MQRQAQGFKLRLHIARVWLQHHHLNPQTVALPLPGQLQCQLRRALCHQRHQHDQHIHRLGSGTLHRLCKGCDPRQPSQNELIRCG